MLSVQPSGPIKGIIGQFATQLLRMPWIRS